jgi:hypothetical protein
MAAKGFALLHLDVGQGCVSRLVFAEPANSFRLLAVLDSEGVGTARWNLIFRSLHTCWTTRGYIRARLLTVTARQNRLFERLTVIEKVLPRIGSSQPFFVIAQIEIRRY